jgi:hypothetical protein
VDGSTLLAASVPGFLRPGSQSRTRYSPTCTHGWRAPGSPPSDEREWQAGPDPDYLRDLVAYWVDR